MCNSDIQNSNLSCFLPCSGDCDQECEAWTKLKHAIETVKIYVGIVDPTALFEALGTDSRIIKHANTLATKDRNKFCYDIGRNSSTGIKYVDTMSGNEFETFIKRLYINMGFEVTLTKKSHDGGIDLIASKDNILYNLQCKRFKSNIGVKYIREFVGVLKANTSKTQGIFITTSNFTKEAAEFAIKCGIQPINRNKLIKLIELFVIDDVPGFKIEHGISGWSTEKTNIVLYLINTSKIKMTNIFGVLCFYNDKGRLIDEISPKVFQNSLEEGEKLRFEFEMNPIEASYYRLKLEFDRDNNKDTYRSIESSKMYPN